MFFLLTFGIVPCDLVKTIPPHAQQEMSPRLLPFVLAGISDESPEVQARSLDLMDGIGEYVIGSTRPCFYLPQSISSRRIRPRFYLPQSLCLSLYFSI